jgi:hypothetical protein
VRRLLDEIRENVLAFYSYQNFKQASPQMAALQEAPSKPGELILLDDLSGLRMPFVGGGYVDQPWLLIQLMAAAAQAREVSYQSLSSTAPPSQ